MWDQRGPRRGRAQRSSADERRSTGARDAGQHRGRRRWDEILEMPSDSALAAAGRPGAARGLRVPAVSSGRGGGLHRRPGGRARRLPPRGAGGGMRRELRRAAWGGRPRAGRARRTGSAGRRPSGWWAWPLLIATEATLFALPDRHLLLPALPDNRNGRWAASRSRRVTLPLVFTAVLVASSVPISWRSKRRSGGAVAPPGGCSARDRRAGDLPRRADRLMVDDLDTFAPRRTPTARSTSRCSPPTTRTSPSGCCSTSGCSGSSRTASPTTG